jgi:hypothetical protein
MVMTRKRKLVIWGVVIGTIAVVVAAVLLVIWQRKRHKPITIRGAVLKQDSDPRKQSPVENVEVHAADGTAVRDAKSDFIGGFALTLPKGVKLGTPVRLTFHHPDFVPLELNQPLSDKILVVHMVPLHGEVEAALNQTETKVGNVVVRYSTETMRTENIGSAIKTFQVTNDGNVPCNNRPPCSPDGKWKASMGSASLDAGEGNVFRDARVSCIAGPCPFTRIDTDGFSRGGRNIRVSVRNWSDTTTFLLQAEVFRSQLGDVTRRVYPVIFGRALNFTLPSTAQGPSIEADLNGSFIVFPLGPNPILSWANCQVRVEKNEAKDYRCELKPGYGFR